MLQKIIVTLLASIFLVSCEAECCEKEMPFSACEISNIIYNEYVMVQNDLAQAQDDHYMHLWLEGYSSACLHLYMKINLIQYID